MSFDPSIVNFLTVGNFSDPTYGMTQSQNLVTAPNTGLYFQNAGGGSTYTLNTSGNLSNLMTLQNTTSYGLVVSVPQVDGGLITRQMSNSSSITITHPGGQGGSPSFEVTPSTTLQLTQIKIGGSNAGAPHSAFNLVAGTGIGLSYADTGTQTDITISSSLPSGALANGPFITYTASSNLTDEQNLGALTTGLLKNTVAAGSATLSTAVSGTDYLAPNANLTAIGALAPTNGTLLYYTGGAWSLLSPGAIGTILTTTGASSVGFTTGASVLANWSSYPALINIDFNTKKGINCVDPTSAQDVATKNYVDLNSGGAPVGASYLVATANGTLTSEVNLGGLATGLVLSTVAAGVSTVSTVPQATFGAIAGANAWTSTNTFNTSLPTSTVTPSGSTDLVTKAYTDNSFVALTGDQTIAGIKTCSSPIVTSGASITANTIPAASVVGTAATLSATNAFTGTNTFNTSLPTSTVTPSGSTDLVTKTYVDSGFMRLTSANVQTTNATTTTLATIPIATNKTVTIIANIVGGTSAGLATASFSGSIQSCVVNTSGTLSEPSTPWTQIIRGTSTMSLSTSISGTDYLVRVTGIAATTIDWKISYYTLST